MDLESDIRFGDFQIIKRLGSGGMGVVYKARQVSLDRVVALKVLGSALNRESDISRFQREAQAIAKLDHPSIASVHFIGQDDRVCYMAMEFIDGASLREVIDRLSTTTDASLTLDSLLHNLSAGEQTARVVRFDQPTETYVSPPDKPAETTPVPSGLTPEALKLIALPAFIRRCVEIVLDAALALSHAHDRGVIHRDIKPENLLIDRTGKIFLIDFGIARFFEDMTLTGTGMLVGTPLYMSPEQVTGRLEVDHRADIYALGLVLYELLTLRRPVEAPTRDAVLRQIVTKAMVPVSRRNGAVPRDLEGVVHKAMAKDPEERYQNATELVGDLDRWLAGKPVIANPYHYKFDERQLAAERPLTATISAFSFLFFSLFSAAFAITTLVNGNGSYSNGRFLDWLVGLLFDAEWLSKGQVFFVAFICICIPLCIWIGRGLLIANSTAFLSAKILVVMEVLILPLPLIARIADIDLIYIDTYFLVYYLPFFPLIAITPILLFHPSTRSWIGLSERLRSEHENEVESKRSRVGWV